MRVPAPAKLLPAASKDPDVATPKIVAHAQSPLLQGPNSTGPQHPPSAAVQRQALVTQGLPAMLQHMRYRIAHVAPEDGVKAVCTISCTHSTIARVA